MKLHEISQDKKGICGFVSMIQILIDHGKLTMEEFQKSYGDATKFTQEWMNIQIEHDEGLKSKSGSAFTATALNQSLKFTHDFGSKYEYTVDDLAGGRWEGLALIPEAVCDYLDRRYGLKMQIDAYDGMPVGNIWSSESSNLGNGIYGVRKPEAKAVKGFQLSHYVYIDRAGNLMTWESINATALGKITGTYEEALVRLHPQ